MRSSRMNLKMADLDSKRSLMQKEILTMQQQRDEALQTIEKGKSMYMDMVQQKDDAAAEVLRRQENINKMAK